MDGGRKRRQRRAAQRISLCREGVRLGTEVVPLLAGALTTGGSSPRTGARPFRAVRSLGLRLVDAYVPWSVHDERPGEFDFGEHDPRLDVVAFLRLAAELGLYAIVGPGPHINAELTHFGMPERVIWDPECQARSPGGNPVMLPVPPLAFPVPSYASDAFHDEVAQLVQRGRRASSRRCV